MSILYNEQKKLLTLETKNASYQMQIDSYGFLRHLYYGRRVDGRRESPRYTAQERQRRKRWRMRRR